jgi:hypothetical protein
MSWTAQMSERHMSGSAQMSVAAARFSDDQQGSASVDTLAARAGAGGVWQVSGTTRALDNKNAS